jgi:hypothetical protein
MLVRVFSCAMIGLDGVAVEIEVDTGLGLQGMTIVGLPFVADKWDSLRFRGIFGTPIYTASQTVGLPDGVYIATG